MERERTELMRVLELRKGANVKRYHTEYLIGHQTNAEHSHGVAMLLIQFYPHLANSNTISACLYHDLPEGFVGDLPAPAKWTYPDLHEKLNEAEADRAAYLGIRVGLSDAEGDAVHTCDYLEAMLFSYEQIKLGNKWALVMFVQLFNRLAKKLVPTSVSALIQQMNMEVHLEV